MVAEGDKRGEHVEEDGGLNIAYLLPDLVRNAVRSRGRGGGALAQGLFYFICGEGGDVPVRGEPSSGRGWGLGGKKC